MATTTQSIENLEAGEGTLGLNSLIGTANTDPLPIVEITASDPEASEAGLDTATFTITRSGGDLSQPLSVFYSFTGSAAAGSDFERLSSPIIIPANTSSVDLVVTPIDDDAVESLERLNLFLSDGTNYDLGASNTASITIADDDSLPPPPPIVSIAPPTLSVEEGDSGSFTVSRTGDTTESLQVSISLSPDADLTVDDFSLTGNILAASDTQIQLIIPEGETSTALNFTATSDVFAEAVESLELTVTDTTTYDVSPTAGSAIASIAESAAVVPTVSLTPDARLVDEGESTSFTVTRTGSTDGNLFVNIRLNPDAGLTTDDFSFGGNVLVVTDSLIRVSIPDGEASSNLVFTAETDALAEPQESLELRIINVDAYDVDATANSAIASIAPSDAIIPTGSITIVHDTDVADGTDFDFAGDLGSFTLDDATPDDGDAFGNQIVFDEVPVGTYTIQALPEGGFDLATIDVAAADGSSNLPAGSATVTVAEGEAVVITFSSEQVVPEDIDYAIAATGAEVAEGNTGTIPITFTLTRSGTTTGSSSVEFLLAGDAVLGEDYSFDPATGVTGTGITVTETAGVFTVTFAPNATDATLTLNVTGDTVIEPNETVQVQLQNGTAPNGSATISAPDAATTILNDDEPLPPQDIDYAVATDTDSLSEGNAGSQTISFTVSRTGATGVASQVELALGGSAGLGTDYEFIGITGATLSGDPLNPTIAFATGETTATLTFSVLGDTVIEPDETLVATLSNGTAPDNATISIPSATTTILNDDEPLPLQDIDYAVATDTDSLSEGNAGSQTISFTISRTGATDVASQVELALGGSAGLGSDYEFIGITGATLSGDPLNPTITFAADETTATLTFSVLGDTVIEPDETLVATLSNGTAPDNATISVPTATTTILNDDELLPSQDIDYAVVTDTDSLSEGDAGSQTISFAISRTGATDVASQIELALGGSAGLGADYEFIGITGATLSGDPLNPTIAFAAGETTATLTFSVVGDIVVEPDETLIATLSNGTAPDNATISIPSATTTILNDDTDEPPLPDAGPLLDLSDEVGPTAVVFEITREAALDNVIQFYEIDDNQGTVAGLAPGDEGYAEAALSRIVPGVEVVGTDGTTLSQTVTLEGGKLYAPVLFTHGDPGRPLFSFNEANPGDRIQVRSPEPNLFLFEDLVGGDDDFDDLIIEATIVSSEAADGATATSLMASTSSLLDGLDLDLSQLPGIDELPTVDEALSTVDIDDLTGLATVGAELLQQVLTETGVDGVIYFYETDALGQVDGLSPLNPAYEDAVLNNIISQVTLSDLVAQPLSVEVPSEPNYGVAVALNTEPDNLYTVQDLLTLDPSIPDLGGALV
ncbi:MAG: Calx-beta domain-containing protein [Cyanobacteria bacterium J06638_22]